jgi:IS4 transposase
VIRKSEEATRKAQRRLRRKESKKQKTFKPETYRMRWQIELVFKRLKSLLRLGHLPKYDERSSRAWLYGKLLIALLTQKLIRTGREFSPWGYLLPESAGQPLA